MHGLVHLALSKSGRSRGLAPSTTMMLAAAGNPLELLDSYEGGGNGASTAQRKLPKDKSTPAKQTAAATEAEEDDEAEEVRFDSSYYREPLHLIYSWLCRWCLPGTWTNHVSVVRR